MRKVSCVICGTEFETDHPTKKLCGEECQKKNKREKAKKWYMDNINNPEFVEHVRKVARENYKPAAKCRLCGKIIEQDVLPTGHTHKFYHDDCVIKDCLSTIYEKKKLTQAQKLRLYSRGYTLKELKEEFINV